MTKRSVTLFSWGYWGWGTASERFVAAVDSIEATRGFAPPLFVDVRWSRSVRAPGFRDRALEQLVGSKRYHWMKNLGNKRIETRSGPLVQIAVPSAAAELLDLALQAAKEKRRIIFFCACEIPAHCHRAAVAKLVSSAATKTGNAIEIIEWPGGEPRTLELKVPHSLLVKVRGGQHSIPLTGAAEITELAALPWYSDVHLQSGSAEIECLCSPAMYRKKGGWQLTSLAVANRPVDDKRRSQRIHQYRKEFGYERVG